MYIKITLHRVIAIFGLRTDINKMIEGTIFFLLLKKKPLLLLSHDKIQQLDVFNQT